MDWRSYNVDQHGSVVSAPPDVHSAITTLVPAWQGIPLQKEGTVDVQVTVDDNGFLVTSKGLSQGTLYMSSPLDAANAAAGALIGLAAASPGGPIALHAASIQLATGVVCLLADSGGGKSTLSLAMAAHGARLLGDDRVLLGLGNPPDILPFGLRPKMRLPIPDDLDRRTVAFIARHRAFDGHGIAFLAPQALSELSSAVGATDIVAFVLLDRTLAADADPVLEPLAVSETLRAVIRQSIAPGRGSGDVMKTCVSLCKTVPAFRARYRATVSLVPVLLETFGATAMTKD